MALEDQEEPLKDLAFEAVDLLKEHDLDWAGKSGITCCPLTINEAELDHGWHSDVEADGPMETVHDAFALHRFIQS